MAIKKLLIRGVNWMGDAVMTMPAIRALKGAFADHRVSLLANSMVLPLFEKDPNVGSLIEYEDSMRGFTGKFRLASLLRKEKFTSAVLLQNAFDAALLAFLSGIGQRIGYSRDGRGFLLTKAVPLPDDYRISHHVDYYLNLLKDMGLAAPRRQPWVYMALSERLLAREALSALARPVIGINPGAAYGSAKRWPTRHFTGVIKRIILDMGGSAVVFGSPNETAIAGEIERALPSSLVTGNTFLNLSGRTTVRELCSYVSECDALISNDSGPMHLAYALGTPLVAIFGSTSPALTGPPEFTGFLETGSLSSVIHKALPCSPCFKRTCLFAEGTREHMQCMEAIAPEEVYACLRGILPTKRAVFFDRDGTLCHDANYLSKHEDFRPFKNIERLRELRDRGFLLIGISNQSGIARGIVSEDFTKEINQIFIDTCGFDDFLYCPHHPDDNCACRKPSPGMLLKAGALHGIDLRKSFMVGDSNSDVEAALAAGAEPVFILNQKHTLQRPGVITISSLDDICGIIK
ncbi:MAG: lipopolysaccharide heptosyltransferase II [Nitrospirae bacterium]|nr:lipopolysaccharide heptosyltransferase II [Nitrospirota bacterium]